MKDLLEKLHLLQYQTIRLNLPKTVFVSRLREQVDEGSIGIFSDSFDVFSSSKNEYKGHVDLRGFRIKRRKRLFDFNMNLAIASGTYREEGEQLIIDTEINGFSGVMIPFYIFVALFYVIFIAIFLGAGEMDGAMPVFVLPFILLHALFMFGLPYLLMRGSVSRMQRELEREFFFLTKQ
ncbi:hypothetical protein [Lewinella sp. W8]|uniref:hypothetical protein n=1 Tax=Lewinella sp. W8 TaxID=2528208 RepID=UPI0010676051|nr:hypothetical protein [Lewinella sp. W8]MTB50696.1 hypothetical protein [Lewinella sp. W8]